MHLKKIVFSILLYSFSFIQCMELTPSHNPEQITDAGLQKLIEQVNKVSLNIVTIIKQKAERDNIEFIPKTMGPFFQLTQKEMDNIFLANIQDDNLRPLLLSMGADIKAKREHGENCLWYVRKPELLTELINKGAEVDNINTDGTSLLNSLLFSSYTEKKDIDTARIILAHSTNEEMKQKNYGLLFHDIIDYKNRDLILEAIQLLCEYKINVNMQDSLQRTPLIEAIRKGFTSVVELLLQHGATEKINTPDFTDEYPLHIAMEKKYDFHSVRSNKTIPKIVLLLLQYGANPNIAYRDGQTMPLHVATERNEPEIIKELVVKKADRFRINREGLTAYDIAKQRKCNQEILALLYVIIKPQEEVIHTRSLRTSATIKKESELEQPQPQSTGSTCSIQ